MGDPEPPEVTIIGTVAGAGTGAVVGGVAGALAPARRWQDVPISARQARAAARRAADRAGRRGRGARVVHARLLIPRLAISCALVKRETHAEDARNKERTRNPFCSPRPLRLSPRPPDDSSGSKSADGASARESIRSAGPGVRPLTAASCCRSGKPSMCR